MRSNREAQFRVRFGFEASPWTAAVSRGPAAARAQPKACRRNSKHFDMRMCCGSCSACSRAPRSGSWPRCASNVGSRSSMNRVAANVSSLIFWRKIRADSRRLLPGVVHGPLPLFGGLRHGCGKALPFVVPRPLPKRQRTGALQDLAEFPPALVVAKRLGLR